MRWITAIRADGFPRLSTNDWYRFPKENSDVEQSSKEPPIAVQTNAQKIDADVAHNNHNQS